MNSASKFFAGFLTCALASCAQVPVVKVKPMLGRDTWRNADGKEMPWRGREVPRGEKLRAVVITVHGLSGAASDFWMLEKALPPRGIAVCGLELRGQGNDPDLKRRGDISSARIWQQDLLTFHDLIREKHPGVPVFWYAESLGGLIALHAVPSACKRGPVDSLPAGIVISSPAAGLKIKPGPCKQLLLKTAMIVLPFKKVNLEKTAGLRDQDLQVTAHTTHGAQMAVTPHRVPKFTLRLLRECYHMIQNQGRAAQQLTIPVLVLASPNDVIASPEQVRAFFERIAAPDRTIRWYQKSHHLLLHDVQRETVLEDTIAWLEAHLKRQSP